MSSTWLALSASRVCNKERAVIAHGSTASRSLKNTAYHRSAARPQSRRRMALSVDCSDVGCTLSYERQSSSEMYAAGARRRGCDVTTEAMQELMRRAHREFPRQVGGAFRYTDTWFEVYIERIFHA